MKESSVGGLHCIPLYVVGAYVNSNITISNAIAVLSVYTRRLNDCVGCVILVVT